MRLGCSRATNAYGVINEPFYHIVESMFHQAVQLIIVSDLRDQLDERCQRAVSNTGSIGWGFHDTLSDIHDQYFV